MKAIVTVANRDEVSKVLNYFKNAELINQKEGLVLVKKVKDLQVMDKQLSEILADEFRSSVYKK
jgi:hypothetical protein